VLILAPRSYPPLLYPPIRSLTLLSPSSARSPARGVPHRSHSAYPLQRSAPPQTRVRVPVLLPTWSHPPEQLTPFARAPTASQPSRPGRRQTLSTTSPASPNTPYPAKLPWTSPPPSGPRTSPPTPLSRATSIQYPPVGLPPRRPRGFYVYASLATVDSFTQRSRRPTPPGAPPVMHTPPCAQFHPLHACRSIPGNPRPPRSRHSPHHKEPDRQPRRIRREVSPASTRLNGQHTQATIMTHSISNNHTQRRARRQFTSVLRRRAQPTSPGTTGYPTSMLNAAQLDPRNHPRPLDSLRPIGPILPTRARAHEHSPSTPTHEARSTPHNDPQFNLRPWTRSTPSSYTPDDAPSSPPASRLSGPVKDTALRQTTSTTRILSSSPRHE